MDPRFAKKEKSAKTIWLRRLLIFVLGALLTLAYFLVLPFLQQLGDRNEEEEWVREAPVINETPPPDAPPEQEEEPPEPEEAPEMEADAQPLDLSQLDMALNPAGAGDSSGAFVMDVSGIAGDMAGSSAGDFSMGDLDKEPRALYRPNPRYPREMQRQGIQGTVFVAFIVSESGRVEKAKVKESTHPGFDKAALDAVRRWTFEPGAHKGKPVSFRMVIPITFSLG